MKEQRKEKESLSISIIPFEPIYQQAFKELNKEWISTYFTMEAEDYKVLDNPQGYILDKGGYIAVALYNDEPVGVCALIKTTGKEDGFELAKMAVSPKVQRKNIGWLLGQAVVDRAVELGAAKLYLESNTILTPAINLYHKLGFKKVAAHPTHAMSSVVANLKK